ncbi:hypothetical protein ACQSMD_29745 [Streptomyces flavovirens]|uniref:hypothetical protein n=1 Tax=Streptomyces flavovirens TaxID=52258 RepID=UPI003D141E7A
MKTSLVPRVYQPDSFAQLLERRLNLTPGFEAGRLEAEQVANLTLLTVAQAPAYTGTARLVALVRSLPVPSEEPQEFWFKLWTEADDPVLLPGNLRHQLLRAVDGDGAALARGCDTFLAALSGRSHLRACFKSPACPATPGTHPRGVVGITPIHPVSGRPSALRSHAPDAAGPALRADGATSATSPSCMGHERC